jgi:hypothetical protein
LSHVVASAQNWFGKQGGGFIPSMAGKRCAKGRIPVDCGRAADHQQMTAFDIGL